LIGVAPEGLKPGELSVVPGVHGSTLGFHLMELMHARLMSQERESRKLNDRPSTTAPPPSS
jgi:hypothetical protein